MDLPKDLSRFEALTAIIARLRGPEGCPWDREQTHASLRENLLSESYEVLQALDEGESHKLCEELGDLLLQIVLHAQIADDDGEFTIGDVISGINEKLIYRHPHVFGSEKAETAEAVAHNWEELKAAARGDGVSVLESVPGHMPALAYSLEVQRRVARVGFDWENVDGVIEKLVEEVEEYRQASGEAEKTHEFGDILFTLVNVARREGIDSEAALREANRRFFRRFTRMEALCRERGLTFGGLSFEAQNGLWEEAKKGVAEDE